LNRTQASAIFFVFSIASITLAAQNRIAFPARVTESNLPIVFEPASNPDATAMIGRSAGMSVAFQSSAVLVELQGESTTQFEVDFIGANSTVPHGTDLQKSQTNYFLGNDPKRWRTHVPNYARVTYADLYPQIDAVFYGNGHEMEHDFIVSPGGDYRKIRMRLSKYAQPYLDKNGELIITLKDGSLQMRKPVIYQIEKGRRQQKIGSFRILPNGDVGFNVESYDRHSTLIIDPILSFATYISSTAGVANVIATDGNGNNYVSGVASVGFPVTPNAFAGCATCQANAAATFIAKLSPDGSTLIYSALLGGNSFAQSTGIAVDANGNAVVSGWTGATDFPTKFGQQIAPPNNAYSGFLVSLSADGSSLNYGTLLGSSASYQQSTMTYAEAVALDSAGNAYVTGTTGRGFFVTSGALNQGDGGNSTPVNENIFLAKFSPTGSLVYGAVLGTADPQNGGGGPIGASAITVDTTGEVYVTGQAGTAWPTSTNAYIKQIPGSTPYAAPFVMKVSSDAKSVIYSTYLDYAYVVKGITLLPSGNVFLAGDSVGANYPTTANAYQQNSSSGGGSFLTELSSGGSSLVYSTVIGDSTYTVNGLALDPDGDIWLAAQTRNSQFPLVTPLQSTFPLASSVVSVVNQFDPTGQILKFSTFLGGSANGYASSVAIDSNHRAHISGAAQYGMSTTPGAYLGSVPVPGPGFNGTTYGYVALIDTSVPAPAVCVTPNTSLSMGSIPAGTFAEGKITITSCGTQPLTISSVSTAAGVFTVPASTNGCLQILPVGQSCTLKVRYSPTSLETDSSILTIQSDASIPQTVLPINGSGVVPSIAVNGTPTFDYTIVGQTSAPQFLSIQNRGGAPLILDPTKTTISGDFSIQGLGSCGSPIVSVCSIKIYFAPTAPGTRTGTINIASNDPSRPSISVSLQGMGYVSAPVPQITALTSQLVQAGTAETSFTVAGYGFLPSSVVQVNGVAQQTTYSSSHFLTANLAASSIPANSYGELAVTVVTPAPGGGTSAPYFVTEFQLVPAANAFMVYDSVGKQIFVSTPASAATNANTILPINPVTASVGTPIPVGNDPGVLALSADGKYLYVALNADHAIQRINPSTNAIERTFPLPVDQQYGNLRVFDMHVVPGSDTEVVASLIAAASSSEDGIALFDDGGLVNWIPGLPQANRVPTLSVDRFTFTNDPSTLYAIRPYNTGFVELSYSPAGLQNNGNSCCASGSSQSNTSHITTDGPQLYTDTGAVWNPSSGGTLVNTYPLPASTVMDSVIPDASTGKTYYLNPSGSYFQYPARTVLAFDQTSLAQTGALSFTTNTNLSNLVGTQLVRWGSNGFAFRASNSFSTTGSSIFLFTSSIASASNLNPAAVASTLAPASMPAAGPDFILTVNGSGFIPGSTVEWNGSPRLTTVVSSTQLTATIYASDIATTGTSQVVVVNPGQGGGTSGSLTFTIGAPLPPAPTATLTPASLVFPSQAVGTSASAQTVALTNSGNADLTGIAVVLSGTGAASFSQSNTCGSVVHAGESCTISVVFTPVSAGTASATLTVSDNAGNAPQTASLSGSGFQPAVPIASLSPTSLTFPSQAVGTSSGAQTVTLTNSGNADLTGIAVVLSGTDAASFSQTSTCGSVVHAGGSCSISVTFTPVLAGSASAMLSVSDSAASSPQTTGITGSAPQASFVINPQNGTSTSSTVASGRVATYALVITPANGYSGTLALTCSNLPANASCTFSPSSLSLTGGNPGTFSVTVATAAIQTAELLRNVSLCSMLIGFVFLLPKSNRGSSGSLIISFVLVFAVVISVIGCGGHGTTVNAQQTTVTPGTYTVQVVASDGTTKQIQPLTLVVQ
jgi:hypothetical protein